LPVLAQTLTSFPSGPVRSRMARQARSTQGWYSSFANHPRRIPRCMAQPIMQVQEYSS